MYSPRMNELNELCNERQRLWFKAGKEGCDLTREEQLRLHELNQIIPAKWAEYRKALVEGEAPPRLHPTRPNILVPEEEMELA